MYSIRDLGAPPSANSFDDAQSGRVLVRVDATGATSVANLRVEFGQEAAYHGPLPVGSGAIVYRPTYSDDGRYGVGTSKANSSSQAYWGGFLVRDGEATFITPGSPSSQAVYLNQAYAVNNAGQVAGMAIIDNSQFTQAAVLNPDGTHVILGSLGGLYSMALDINNLGQAVGQSGLPDMHGRLYQHGFVTQGDRLIDLNSLLDPADGWEILSASSINDLGQIAAVGIDPTGVAHTLLLTPTPVPEPTLIAFAALTAFGLGATRGRRSR